MWDVPDHLLIPLNEQGEGPVYKDDFYYWGCWCGDIDCTLFENEPYQLTDPPEPSIVGPNDPF